MIIYRSNSGMSLPSLMISVAIMGIIATGMVSLFISMGHMQNTSRYSSNTTNFHEELRAHLSSKEACTLTFQSLVVTSGANYNIPTVKNKDGSDGYVAGQKYAEDTILLERMNLSFGANLSEGILDFYFRSTRRITGNDSRKRTILIKVEKNASNAITSCIAKAKMSDGIWTRVVNNINDIYFVSGNVGIGTSEPAFPLEVNVSSASSTSNFVQIKGNSSAVGGVGLSLNNGIANGSQWSLTSEGGAGAPVGSFGVYEHSAIDPGDRLTILKGGSVGIGTFLPIGALHVAGSTPNVLTVERKGGGLNSAIKFLNGSGKSMFLGLASDETFGVGPAADLTSSETWLEVNRSLGSRIRSRSANILTLERTESSGDLNTTIRFLNGGSSDVFAGMSSLETFAVGATANLSLNPWFNYNRKAAQPSGGQFPTFSVDGNIFLSGSAVNCRLGHTAGGIACSSDIRLKKNIHPIEGALAKLLKVRGVEFDWNEKSLSAGKHDIGLIAQEVEAIFPQATELLPSSNNVTSDFSSYLGVSYSSLVAPIIEAIRELSNTNSRLSNDQQAMREEVRRLKIELEALRTKVRSQPSK